MDNKISLKYGMPSNVNVMQKSVYRYEAKILNNKLLRTKDEY